MGKVLKKLKTKNKAFKVFNKIKSPKKATKRR